MSMNLSHLIPAAMPAVFNEDETEATWKQLESGIAVYFLTDPTPAMKSEFFLWRRKWQKVSADDHPKSAVSALDHCGHFLNMKLLLQLLATLPIKTAEAERVFSKMEKTATAIQSIKFIISVAHCKLDFTINSRNGRESAQSSSTSSSTPRPDSKCPGSHRQICSYGSPSSETRVCYVYVWEILNLHT